MTVSQCFVLSDAAAKALADYAEWTMYWIMDEGHRSDPRDMREAVRRLTLLLEMDDAAESRRLTLTDDIGSELSRLADYATERETEAMGLRTSVARFQKTGVLSDQIERAIAEHDKRGDHPDRYRAELIDEWVRYAEQQEVEAAGLRRLLKDVA